MRVPVSSLQRCALLLIAASTISAKTYNTRSPDVQWDDDNWAIINRVSDSGRFQSRKSLSNGYLGITLAAMGPFFDIDDKEEDDSCNGWPLFNRRQTFSTIAGFYGWHEKTSGSNHPWLFQYGGESVISGIPHWSGLNVRAHGALLNARPTMEDIQDFSSTMDMAAGQLSWRYRWKPRGKAAIKVQYTMFVHKLYVNRAAVQLELTASRDTNVTIYDVLEGQGALRSDLFDKKYETDSKSIWSAFTPNNVDVTAYVYSTLNYSGDPDLSTRAEVAIEEGVFWDNKTSIGQSLNISLTAGETVVVQKFIGAASSDAFDDPQEIARNASQAGAEEGFVNLLGSHIDEWSSILTKDSVDRYYLENGTLPNDVNIQELHITSVTNPFNILQNTVGPNAIVAAGNNTRLGVDSIPVCGLGSDCYGGLIFWDADVWMAPGLQLSHPLSMQQIVRYRLEKFPQAQENIKMAYTSSKNTTGRFSTGGAVYPWTSGRYGNCSAVGPCFDYEYHLNGDIGLLLYNQLAVTGDYGYFEKDLFPVYNAIAYFYGELLDRNETTGMYVLNNATDPDENADYKNNVAFTTALIKTHLIQANDFRAMFGLPQNETWNEKAVRMNHAVNEDANIILEHEGMNGTIEVKQADVVLIDDLLPYYHNYSLSDLDYYAAKQSPKGPGMTWGVYSIVANKISPSGCSSGMKAHQLCAPHKQYCLSAPFTLPLLRRSQSLQTVRYESLLMYLPPQYTYGLYSSQPYIRFPWFTLSEQLEDKVRNVSDTHPGFPFLTGMGGANRVGIFGYLGLRLFLDSLNIDPSLPPQIELLNYRVFYWQGYGINATSNQTHTILERLPLDKYKLPNANATYATSPIPITRGSDWEDKYNLGFDAPVVVPNRQIGTKKTMKGNLLQCVRDVRSDPDHVPGQFPLAAIDGAASTKWQPVSDTDLVYLTVDLGNEKYPIKSIFIDWAALPPRHYEVVFTNHSQPPYSREDWEADGFLSIVVCDDVEISRPYDPSRVSIIETYKGNQTNYTLPLIKWSLRYVHLGIKGGGNKMWANSTGNATAQMGGGATVAEWNIIVADSNDLKEEALRLQNEREHNRKKLLGEEHHGKEHHDEEYPDEECPDEECPDEECPDEECPDEEYPDEEHHDQGHHDEEHHSGSDSSDEGDEDTDRDERPEVCDFWGTGSWTGAFWGLAQPLW